MLKRTLVPLLFLTACHNNGAGVDNPCVCNGGVITPVAVQPVTWVDNA